MVNYLSGMGVKITGTDDGMIIEGGNPLHGTVIDSLFDHRIALSFSIASLLADGETIIKGSEQINVSYPSFYNDLMNLQ